MNHRSLFQYCPYDGQRLSVDKNAADARPTCSKCRFVDHQNPKACVAILIVRDGKLLLARRGDEPAKGAWDIPGGFVDRDESVEQAVVREAFEETNLRVRVTEYLGSVPDLYGSRQVPTISLCFLVEVLDGDLKAKDDVESLAWVPLDKLPRNMAFPHQGQAFELLKRRMRVKGIEGTDT